MARKVTNPSQVPRNAILLSKVYSLTLRNGEKTSSRRVDPAPQLLCVGPEEICRLYTVDVMQCANEGADYDAENIQWSCKASMPDDFKLGSTDVVCEGYESSHDPYILKGSCGVEYRLLLTDKGERKYGSMIEESERPSVAADFSKAPGVLFFLIFSVVLFIILREIWSSWNRHPPRLGGTRPNGGGRGDDNDPPPPYDEQPPFYSPSRKPRTKTTAQRSGTASSSTRANSSRSAPRAAQEQSWRPGFWTGTAAGATVGGAAATYFANSRSQSARREPLQPETRQRSGGFFSNFGAPQERPPAPPSSSSSSNTSPNHSSTQHESTGFGSTRRR